MHQLLIEPEQLKNLLNRPELAIADMRWYSGQPGAGQRAYSEAHVPGAIYVDLDHDLSDQTDPKRGRHPLPDPHVFAATLTRLGIGPDSHVVIYDDASGSNAGRLWWMLKWIGHENASILNGGIPEWQRLGFPLESGQRQLPKASRPMIAHPRSDMLVDREALVNPARDVLILDARAPERFRGEVEPIDFRAGHIPGATNAPWAANIDSPSSPRFKSTDVLREAFVNLGVDKAREVICYCGSGVTACHNLFALELAGLTGAKLYPGSWSEWIHHS